MKASLAAMALSVVSLPRARCLLGTAAPPTEASPESVERVLQPAITFTLAAEPAAAEQTGGEADWRRLARTVAQLQQLECTEDVLGAQVRMVDAAEEGDRLAMAALGSMFLLGQECARKRNLTWGYHWLSRAAELEQPDALALLGFLHTTDVLRDLYNFTAVTHDRAAGIRLLQRGAAGGSPFANLAMGFRYMAGAGVVESCPTSGVYYEAAALSAREWLDERRQRSVEQSNPTEQEHLTLLARNMPPRDRMDAANVEYIDYCAAIGDVQGQLGMGQLLHAGSHGVEQDRRAAAHWFRSAAALGEGMGHANDGMMRLRDGRDAAGAVRALRRAAKLQDPSGWAGLAYAHLYGAGVAQSDEMAARAMCMAAQNGHLDSIFNIGVPGDREAVEGLAHVRLAHAPPLQPEDADVEDRVEVSVLRRHAHGTRRHLVRLRHARAVEMRVRQACPAGRVLQLGRAAQRAHRARGIAPVTQPHHPVVGMAHALAQRRRRAEPVRRGAAVLLDPVRAGVQQLAHAELALHVADGRAVVDVLDVGRVHPVARRHVAREQRQMLLLRGVRLLDAPLPALVQPLPRGEGGGLVIDSRRGTALHHTRARHVPEAHGEVSEGRAARRAALQQPNARGPVVRHGREDVQVAQHVGRVQKAEQCKRVGLLQLRRAAQPVVAPGQVALACTLLPEKEHRAQRRHRQPVALLRSVDHAYLCAEHVLSALELLQLRHRAGQPPPVGLAACLLCGGRLRREREGDGRLQHPLNTLRRCLGRRRGRAQ